LVCGMLFAAAAVGAALVSLLVENDLLQLVLFAAIMVLGLAGLFLRSRRTTDGSPDVTLQVVLSVSVYGAVWVAACGYMLANILGPAGSVRTVLLHAVSIGLLVASALMLVRTALRSRERYYCLGLASSTLLTGMLLPIVDPHYSYAVAHGLLAVGYVTGVAIQWVQLREAIADHAAD
jgi:hypothetical protein